MTVAIQIGNTDGRLTQTEWAGLVSGMRSAILTHCAHVHFFGGPPNWERWENVAWIVECDVEQLPALKTAVTGTRERYRQDSAAWMVGETKFI